MRRRALAATLTALAASCALIAGGSPASAGVVRVYGGGNLRTAMEALNPGDTLKLNPGTYDIGDMRAMIKRGTSAAPITMIAADPAHPPLLRGRLLLVDADYWRLTSVRIQATASTREALYLGGGTGWIVSNGEFFGASSTNAYANVTIAGSPNGSPVGFRFVGNCVHDAARTTRTGYPDQNMYVNFPGNSRTSGTIDHNLIFRHPNGEGVKLGNGGAAGAPGPWGVVVRDNTIIDGGRQVLLTGDVRNNRISGNILASSRVKLTGSSQTTAIYMHLVTTKTNSLDHNYFWDETLAWWDPESKLVLNPGNRWGPSPAFTSTGVCSGYHSTAAEAAPYGRWGTGKY